MNVYLVWFSQKWCEPELCDIFEDKEDADKQAIFLESKITASEKNLLDLTYYVTPHKVHLSASKTSDEND